MTVKLIVDEDVPLSVIKFLKSAGLAHKTLEDYGLLGASNGKIIDLAMNENLIIVTLDEDFVNIYLYSKSGGNFGVLYIHVHPPETQKIVDAVKSCFKDLKLEEHTKNLIIALEHGKVICSKQTYIPL